MYFSRGNPVVYYGDEQGFTGAGGDQDARQDMFPSQSLQYNNLSDPIAGDDGAGKNDNIGSDETPMDDNFDREPRALPRARGPGAVTRRHPALRDGAQQNRFAASTRGRVRVLAHRPLAQARVRRRAQQRRAAGLGLRADVRARQQVGEGLGQRRAAPAHGVATRRLDVAVAPLSAVVYRAKKHIPRSRQAPTPTLSVSPSADRTGVVADIPHDSFYEVTFLAKVGNGAWKDIGTDDNAPYRVFQDTSDIAPGTQVSYKAIVLDNAGHTRTSATRTVTIPPPVIALEAPNPDQRVRGRVEVRAVATPGALELRRAASSARWTAGRSPPSAPTTRRRPTPRSTTPPRWPTGQGDLPRGARRTRPEDRHERYPHRHGRAGARDQATVHYIRADATTPRGDCTCSATGWLRARPPPEWKNATPFEGTDARRVPQDRDRRRREAGRASSSTAAGRQQPRHQGHAQRPLLRTARDAEIWLGRATRGSSAARRVDTCVVPSAR